MRTDKLDEMLKGRGNWQGKKSNLCGLTSIIPIIGRSAKLPIFQKPPRKVFTFPLRIVGWAAFGSSIRKPSPVRVSIMITSRNRLDDLQRTSQALKNLRPAPDQILITADGYADDTIEFVNSALPKAKLIVNESARGSVASRDRMMHEATGDLVLALDDDSYPEQFDCIARFVPIFKDRPQLAVLHFPQRTDEYPETLTQTDFGPEHLTGSFANSGAVLRRSTYLQLPGFESRFFTCMKSRTTRFSVWRRVTTCFFLPSSPSVTTTPAKFGTKYGTTIVMLATNSGACFCGARFLTRQAWLFTARCLNFGMPAEGGLAG